jgi:signal transduction histidine kinase
VLVVDDSATYLETIGAQLREDGYDAVLCTSGEEALELLAVQSVDCILLDPVMPGISGSETCRRIKGAPGLREIPLIMVTAHDGKTEMIEGLAAGADDFFSKTVGFEVLRARVKAQIRRRQLEADHRRAREQALRNKHLVAQAAELAQTNERIVEANRLKSVFLAHMSHELRTPLNAIIGFAEVLLDGIVEPTSPEHNEFLGDILMSGRHLLRLINDVLDLAKVEAGKLEFRPETISPRMLLEEICAVLRTSSARSEVALHLEIDPTVDPVVLDPGRLKQVAYNFISNALKFTPAGGKVVVRVAAEGTTKFRLEVEDTGPGISEADLARLFSDFQQLAAGAEARHAGTGLGLALTKQLVEAQGGYVGVRSTVGVGSTFFAILPRSS